MNQDTLQIFIQQAIAFGSQAQQSTNLLKGVDNGLIGSLLTIIAGVVIRAIEKRKLRKKGKLTDSN
jgi:hypothetical protein